MLSGTDTRATWSPFWAAGAARETEGERQRHRERTFGGSAETCRQRVFSFNEEFGIPLIIAPSRETRVTNATNATNVPPSLMIA